jgi:Caspase domain
MNGAKTARALIIAVQHYPALKGASVLDGTLKDARRFTKWLMQFKLLPAANIWICATSLRGFPKGVNLLAATKDKIKKAIEELVTAGRDKTSELFVFYSGHGYLVQINREDAGKSVIVPTDFTGPKNSLDKLIGITELYVRLKIWLGGDKHFYFVDACRNQLSAEIGILGLSLDPAEKNKHPEVNFLSSTLPGSKAIVLSGFGPTLVDGLSWNLEAAEPLNGRYFVTTRSLREYIEEKLRRKLDDSFSSGYGQIIEVLPHQGKNKFRIVAETANVSDQFLVVLRSSGQKKRKTIRFSGYHSLITAKPGAWNSIQLFRGKEEWPRIAPAPPKIVDFSKPCNIVFRPPSKGVKLGSKPVPIAFEVDSEGHANREPRSSLESARESAARTRWDRLIHSALDFAAEKTTAEQPEIRVVLASDPGSEIVAGDIGAGQTVDWRKPEQTDGNACFRFKTTSGSKIASFAFSRGLSLSLATIGVNKWITLIVIYRDERQTSKIVQALVQPQHLDKGMLKMAFEIQTNESSPFEAELYQSMGDPITRLFGYRHYGLPSGSEPSVDFPDLFALKRAGDGVPQRFPGAPLLLENLLSVPGWENSLPFPAARLDYSSIWTCWRGAVGGPAHEERS